MIAARKQKILYNAILLISLLISLAAYTMNLKAATPQAENKFLDHMNLDEKVKYVVFHGSDNTITGGLGTVRDAMAKNDEHELFDHNFVPRALTDLDVVIYLLGEWKDANDIEGSGAFRSLFARVAEKDKAGATSLHALVIETPEGKKMLLMSFII